MPKYSRFYHETPADQKYFKGRRKIESIDLALEELKSKESKLSAEKQEILDSNSKNNRTREEHYQEHVALIKDAPTLDEAAFRVRLLELPSLIHRYPDSKSYDEVPELKGINLFDCILERKESSSVKTELLQILTKYETYETGHYFPCSFILFDDKYFPKFLADPELCRFIANLYLRLHIHYDDDISNRKHRDIWKALINVDVNNAKKIFDHLTEDDDKRHLLEEWLGQQKDTHKIYTVFKTMKPWLSFSMRSSLQKMAKQEILFCELKKRKSGIKEKMDTNISKFLDEHRNILTYPLSFFTHTASTAIARDIENDGPKKARQALSKEEKNNHFRSYGNWRGV